MSRDCWRQDFASFAAEAMHQYRHTKASYAEVEERRSITPQEWASITSATGTLAILEQLVAQNAVLMADVDESASTFLDQLHAMRDRSVE